MESEMPEIPPTPISVEKIFCNEYSYKIPIYQRNYAWTEKEITQFIEDINDNDSGYYLGNLIVDNDEKNNCFIVIDGQQRLTTLYIIYKSLRSLRSLKKDINMKLSFDHRKNSEAALNNLEESEGWNKSIATAYSVIKTWATKIEDEPKKEEKFINNLKNSRLLQIEVPEKTNLNHYFEIMNTRGEQLEKIDIVKSNLMKKLGKKMKEFASIWDVCSNMNEYVVKSLYSKRNENNLYEKYFKYSEENKQFTWKNGILESQEYDVKKKSLEAILTDEPKGLNDDNQADGHYDSLVQFPEFLLHTLNIIEGNLNGPLNKENLLERFKRFDDEKNEKREEEIENFIIKLLKYRFFYDMYIGRVKAKQENEGDKDEDKDGIFDIREPIIYGSNSISTRKTFKNDKNIRAIQWALRITYISQKSMHWVTNMLYFVSENNEKSDFDYLKKLKELTREYVKNTEYTDLYDSKENKFNERLNHLGVKTPHIIFAYLDYLLQENEKDPSDDYYKFRTSVEHLYPQNPSEEINDKIRNINNFGNLFLLTRKTNSSLSNLSPRTKFTRIEEIGFTPKLKCAYNTYKQDLNEKWDDSKIEEHRDSVLKILEDDLKL